MTGFFDSLFGRQQATGHWDNVGAGRLHTRTLPQMGCPVCEAEGWIPASKYRQQGYQPNGPAIDPSTVFAPQQTASAAQPPYVGVRPSDTTAAMAQRQQPVEPVSSADALAIATDCLRNTISWLSLATREHAYDEALALELDVLRGVLAELEAGSRQ